MAGRFDYAHYELTLRDRQLNREALSVYVPYFNGCANVLDLACGSGIFLELLTEHGIPAVGVERNPDVVAWVQRQGWNIIERDVFSFLEQSTETYDGVFCSHFLEHLSFDQVLRFIELLTPRVTRSGTVVLVVPNPESIRMQLFGFWRDPEHVRFYHPELLEAVCQHAGLQVQQTNREDIPFVLAPPLWPSEGASSIRSPKPQHGWLKEKIRTVYFQFLRLLRITPYSDIVALEARLCQRAAAQRDALVPWAEKTNEVVNRMWAWPDDVYLVCRKTNP